MFTKIVVAALHVIVAMTITILIVVDIEAPIDDVVIFFIIFFSSQDLSYKIENTVHYLPVVAV